MIHDPGRWYSTVAADQRHELTDFSINYAWWDVICSPAVKRVMLAGLTVAQRFRKRLEWRARGLDLQSSGAAAQRALKSFRRDETYRSAALYLDATDMLASHLAMLNRAQAELQISVLDGPRVIGLDYGDSAALARYAEHEGLLAHLIEAAVDGCPGNASMLVVSVTSAENLLNAMIAVRVLRARNPGIHVCLADHGYENFSLGPHLERLRDAGTLEGVFDTIIESKDERDLLLPWVIERVAEGDPPSGYLRADNQRFELPRAPDREHSPPPAPIYCSEPVLWTRLSPRRCYWSRCTFCTQNSKYDDPKPPKRSEIGGALDRIEAHIEAGNRTFIFSDEAISPAFLKLLCREINERELDILWACRCKLELAYTPELFRQMREAGCFEILFGLESIVPRVLKLMNKYVEGLDSRRIAEIFREMNAEGIRVHVTMIGGFPGETPGELQDTVEFLIESLADLEGATFLLNQFELYPDTPISNDPGKFGIVLFEEPGDMPSRYRFDLLPAIREQTVATTSSIPRCRGKLNTELGWTRFGSGADSTVAHSLYFGSGHGALIKSRPGNPFANPLRGWGAEAP